jgi:hypothetical protein
MDLRVSVLSGKHSATEFHFCNTFCGYAPGVASTETLLCCYPALRAGRDALFFCPAMVFFRPMPAPD